MLNDKVKIAAALADAMGALHIAAHEALESRGISSFSMNYFAECSRPWCIYVHAFERAFSGGGATPAEALIEAIDRRDEHQAELLEAANGESANG